MTPPPHRAGIGSILIDLILVAVILTCMGFLLYCAFSVLAGGVRAATGWRRKRRAWLRGPGGNEDGS